MKKILFITIATLSISQASAQCFDPEIFTLPREKSFKHDFKKRIKNLGCLTQQEISYYHQLSVRYAQQGVDYLEEAERVSRQINGEIGDVCIEAFGGAVVTISAGGNWVAALGLCYASLLRAAPELGSIYGHLESLRMQSEECFRQADFYMNLVRNG